MATLSPQLVSLAGLDPNFDAAEAGGDAFLNGPGRKIVVRVVNAAGAPRTVTFSAENPCNHGFTHDNVLAMADGDDSTVGPFERTRFNNGSGQVAISYDSEVGLTLAVLDITQAGTAENEA